MSRTADPNAKISLLRAAESEFARRGIAETKVEEIARSAGLSKGAFYLHFASKEDALKQVVESFLARCGAQIAPPIQYEHLPSDAASLLEFARDKDRQIYEFFWQNRATVAILQGCQGPHVYLLDSFREQMTLRTEEWIRFWKRRALFREDVDESLVATLICGAHNELVTKLVRARTKPPIEKWIRKVQEVFVRGMGTTRAVHALPRGHVDSPVNNKARLDGPPPLPTKRRAPHGPRNARSAARITRKS